MDPLSYNLDQGPDAVERAGTIHDLRNLIQIAASAVNRLGRSPRLEGDPALAPVLASAKAALRQAGALVSLTGDRTPGDALSVRRLADLEDVAGRLHEILALIRWICAPGIRLLVDAPAGLPRVRCNGVDLQNAVLNLAINARDAMPDGGALSLSIGLADPTTIEIRIADDGVGMTPATLQRAFNPFFTTKADGRGAGLGLAMVRRFAVETGGRVEIASRPGMGTTVRLRLPVDPDEIP